MTTLALAIGHRYLNGKKDIVTITGIVDPSSPDYTLGHRFTDQHGVGYTETGLFNKNNPAHAFNLVGEMPDTVGTTTVVSAEQPGFFAHLGSTMSNNPFKTMLGLTVAAGAGYMAYNNQTNGADNVRSEDAGEIVEAAANLIRSWK